MIGKCTLMAKEFHQRCVPDPSSFAGVLPPLISRTQACLFRAEEYFVAWQGVLTVAYIGFPNGILKLKREVEAILKGLKPENSGSKWPKTTIGCLRDDKTLTMEQLQKLRTICSEESPALETSEPILMDDISVVLYENRQLEKILTETTIPLALPIDTTPPSAMQISYVKDVLGAFQEEKLQDYHRMTSLPGCRSTHYRTPVVEATMVHHLKQTPPRLSQFKARVEAELPGMYEWFEDSSLHITIRALW